MVAQRDDLREYRAKPAIRRQSGSASAVNIALRLGGDMAIAANLQAQAYADDSFPVFMLIAGQRIYLACTQEFARRGVTGCRYAIVQLHVLDVIEQRLRTTIAVALAVQGTDCGSRARGDKKEIPRNADEGP